MAENVMEYILDLKEKLEKLDKAYQLKLNSIEKREVNLKQLENKYLEIEQLQNNIIMFNIGGEYISTNRQLIINSIYESVLKDLLNNLTNNGKSLSDLSDTFIDRNPDYFKFIIEIIRKSTDEYIKNSFDLDLMQNIPFVVSSDQCCLELLYLEIHYYFKQDADKIFDHFNFMYSDKPKLISFTNSVTEVKVSNNFPSEFLDKYRATSYNDISKVNSRKAYFISYDSTITFELDSVKELESIDIKPFTADQNFWVPCEGAGAFCFTSSSDFSDNNQFDFLTSVPDDYGLDESNKVYKLTFDKRLAKYIKFQTGDFTMSISYIKFNFKK